MKTATLSPEPLPREQNLSAELLHKMDAYWRAANYLRSARFISTTIRCCKSR